MREEKFYDEPPKHKKRSQRKSPKKSKHKHLYEPCLLWEDDSVVGIGNVVIGGVYKAKYCTVCGKIGNVKISESVPTEIPGYNRALTTEEMLDKYKDLKVFTVNSIWDKYVTLTVE